MSETNGRALRKTLSALFALLTTLVRCLLHESMVVKVRPTTLTANDSRRGGVGVLGLREGLKDKGG